jgi:hypothetical protein
MNANPDQRRAGREAHRLDLGNLHGYSSAGAPALQLGLDGFE